MANPRYNTQVTQPRGSSARVGKMGGGMMRPMYKKGGKVKKMGPATKAAIAAKKFREVREAKMGGGRIAGAARRAQEHGYYTPDMGMKGGRMYRDGGKVKKPKVKKIAIGIGKAKDYPGIKKIMEMNKKGKKRFKDGGMTKGVKEDPRRDQMKQPLKKPTPAQKGLKKLPTKVRNKMGFMKDGGKVTRRNTKRMNRLEELGRVDAEKGYTKLGKARLGAEKKRIVRELKK